MYMLWYDDSQRTLPERIQRAAEYYLRKFGRSPTCCLVPSGESEIPTMAGPISVESKPNVLECHLMLG